MRVAMLAAALALSACGGGRDDAARDSPAPAPTTMPVPTAMLEPLGEADLAAIELSGELACSFRREADAPPIWLGRGDVGPAAGAVAVVKLGGAVRTLAMAGDGGYDAMAGGARFEGEGVALAIAKSGDEPVAENPQVAMESPIYPAVLTVAVAGEDERAIQGLFECGP